MNGIGGKLKHLTHSRVVLSVRTGAIIGVVLLLAAGSGGTAQASWGAAYTPWSTYPSVDGSVFDTNWDGTGEYVMDGHTHLFVGFNSFGPGEGRGVYEFDVSEAPKLKGGRIILTLNLVGTRYDAIDPNLMLYVGSGNGSLDLEDFASGEYLMTFGVYDEERTPDWYEVHLDVTKQVRQLIHKGADTILFVIRANPSESQQQGGFYFSTVETWYLSPEQFGPAILSFEKQR